MTLSKGVIHSLAVMEAKKVRMDEIESLLKTEMTLDQVHKESGLSQSTSRSYVNALHDEGRVYISRYIVGPFAATKVFKVGNLPDAEKPETREQRAKQEPELHVLQPVIVNVHRDPLDVALFGEYRRAA